MGGKSLVIVMVALIGIALVLPAGQAEAYGGWAWGPAAFAGGLLLGAAIAHPWYAPAPVYVYPPPAYVYAPRPVYYAPNQVYAYPDPAYAPGPARGLWVEVPGQWVNNVWVPPHKAWVPDTSR